MKTRNTLSKALALGALVAVTLVIAAIWQADGAQAGPSPHMRASFGIISLGPGQTARLNVVNTIDDPNIRPEDGRGTRQVTLAFDMYVPPNDPDRPAPSGSGDERSSCVSKHEFAERQSCDAMLGPGESASFDFTNTTDVLVKITAAVVLDDPNARDGGGIDDPNIMPTLEVREAARTIFVLPGVLKGFNPQPDPPGAPAR